MNNLGKDNVLRYSSSKSTEKKEKRNQKICGELGLENFMSGTCVTQHGTNESCGGRSKLN